MEFLFWFFGVFCLTYYGVIVCYSGPSTSLEPYDILRKRED